MELSDTPRPAQYIELAKTIQDQGGAPIEALEVLREGIVRVGPATSLIFFSLEIEVSIGDFDSALAHLDALPPALKNSIGSLIRRGEILDMAGRTLEAQATYTEAQDRLDAASPHRRSTPLLIDLDRQLQARLRAQPKPKDRR